MTNTNEDKKKPDDEITPADPLLRKQPEVREPDAKPAEPPMKVKQFTN